MYRIDFAIVAADSDSISKKAEESSNLLSFVVEDSKEVLAPQITVYGDTVEELFEELGLHLNAIKGALYE